MEERVHVGPRVAHAVSAIQIIPSSFESIMQSSSARTTKRFPSPQCASAIQIVRPLESIAETQPQLRATPSRKLMKPRKDNNDIENEAGHSEHDQCLVTPFAPRQRPDEKDRPKECMKCEIGRVRQLAVKHGNFADTY
jgi:hypothetical protein